MKNHQKSPSRGSFVWTVLLIILLSSFAFITILNNSKSSAIKTNISALRYEDDNYQRLDTCIAILYDAENNSRFFILTSDSSFLSKYKGQLGAVEKLLTEFETESQQQSRQLSKMINSKGIQYQEFINLRSMLDSLLILADQKPIKVKSKTLKRPVTVVRESTQTEVTDSVVVTSNKSSRRLLKRIADAIANKEQEGSTKSYSEKKVNRDSIAEARDELAATLQKLDELEPKDRYSAARRELSSAELKILTTNGRIFQRLQEVLKELKEQEKNRNEEIRENLLSATSLNLQDVSHLYRASILIVILLAVIIINNLIRLYRNNRTILEYAKETEETTKRKGEFISQLTHEIRTPLNSIIGFSHLIDVKNLDSDLKTSVGAIKNSSKILLSLVNEILDFAKYESGKMELVDSDFSVAELLEQTVDIVSVLATEKDIEIANQFTFKPDLIVRGDDFRIKQVVINLVNNALKFTPKGGAVYVNSDFEILDEQKGLLKINVIDTGVGIAPENLEKIFENFVQVSSPGNTAGVLGTGLGLAICKRIVDLFGGQITVDSTVGKGSQFKVTLPLGIVKNKPQETETVQSNEVSLHGKKLLIADDTKINLLLISKVMDKNRINYDLATDGRKAFELFEANEYDLIITDIHMPEMDGVELTKQIRSYTDERKSQLPVLGFTGSSTPESRGEYLSFGMNEVLGKPFEEKELIAILRKLMN